ncbi:ferredoxin-like protein [Chloroflexota bacterium]
MHHKLRFYGLFQNRVIRVYIGLAKLTRIPLLGNLVRRVANIYGKNEHHGYYLTYEDAEQILDRAKSVALGPCACRQVYHNCNAPIMAELAISTGADIFPEIRSKDFHYISIEEARDVLKQCREHKLIPTLLKCKDDFYAICNCCTCCCVPLRLSRNYGIKSAMIAHKGIIEKLWE